MKKPITAERLLELFDYDPTSGHFRRKIYRSPNAKAGQQAGYINPQGYMRLIIDGIGYQGHRLAWLYHYGHWPAGVIDHKDGNRANNAIDNLRDCTRSQNLQNMKRQKNNKCGKKGVSQRPHAKTKTWRATIRHNGKLIHLGNFETKEAAHDAYVQAAKRLFGEYAREN